MIKIKIQIIQSVIKIIIHWENNKQNKRVIIYIRSNGYSVYL